MLQPAFSRRSILVSATLALGLLGAGPVHAQDQPPPPSAADVERRTETETEAERRVEQDARAVEAEAERRVEEAPAPAAPTPAEPPASAPPPAPAAASPPASPSAASPPASSPPTAAPSPAAPPASAAVAPVPIGAPPAVATAPEAWDSRPYILPYEDGQPIPPGYRVDSVVRTGLVIPGAVVFGGMYLSSLAHAALMQSDCENSSCNVDEDAIVALMVPLGGPFAAAAMSDVSSFDTAAYVSGMLQVAGLTMLIVGVSAQDERLLRVAERIELVPTPTGGMVRGAF